MGHALRSLSFVALVACGACSDDHWLGGARTRARDGGPEKDGAVPPAAELVLDADIVLTGDDALVLPAANGGACRVLGNGYQIRSEGEWVGTLTVRGCTFAGLGSASKRALSLAMSGGASASIEDSTFVGSGAVHVLNEDDSTTSFRNNVIESSSVVVLDPSADATVPAFFAGGQGSAQKFFQGNRVHRSTAWFESPNWLIGGDTDAESNVFVGLRAGVILGASDLVMRGNYVHGVHFTGAGDESPVRVMYDVDDALAEHNVLRGGTWVLRGFGGELRYNAILDAEYSGWLQQPFENTRVHHNLFLMCHAPPNEIQAGILLVNDRAAGIEIYNNTLDGGGAAMRLSGAAVTIDDGCFLASLRSNAFVGFPFQRNDQGAGAVRPGVLEGVVPPPPRLGYADYNLFYNPQAIDARNYTVSVPGLTVRADAGFGAHDAPAGGVVDEQVNPGPLGLAGGCFPWSDDDIAGSRVTVSAMLAALRDGYTPAANSALVGAGDPADGAKTPIGAIGDGTAPEDRFGTFGR
jgi:hypothetical protein